jgi:hypothetical protein
LSVILKVNLGEVKRGGFRTDEALGLLWGQAMSSTAAAERNAIAKGQEPQINTKQHQKDPHKRPHHLHGPLDRGKYIIQQKHTIPRTAHQNGRVRRNDYNTINFIYDSTGATTVP